MDKSKGDFQSADERRIVDLAQELLTSLRLALRRLRCECHQGVLTIYGRLPSYYLKQVAQASVARVRGVRRIDNRVEVG